MNAEFQKVVVEEHIAAVVADIMAKIEAGSIPDGWKSSFLKRYVEDRFHDASETLHGGERRKYNDDVEVNGL